MNTFFEFVLMILKNHMFKINLSRFLKKCTNKICLLYRLSKQIE